MKTRERRNLRVPAVTKRWWEKWWEGIGPGAPILAGYAMRLSKFFSAAVRSWWPALRGLHAMADLRLGIGRMKDLFEIWFPSTNFKATAPSRPRPTAGTRKASGVFVAVGPACGQIRLFRASPINAHAQVPMGRGPDRRRW